MLPEGMLRLRCGTPVYVHVPASAYHVTALCFAGYKCACLAPAMM